MRKHTFTSTGGCYTFVADDKSPSKDGWRLILEPQTPQQIEQAVDFVRALRGITNRDKALQELAAKPVSVALRTGLWWYAEIDILFGPFQRGYDEWLQNLCAAEPGTAYRLAQPSNRVWLPISRVYCVREGNKDWSHDLILHSATMHSTWGAKQGFTIRFGVWSRNPFLTGVYEACLDSVCRWVVARSMNEERLTMQFDSECPTAQAIVAHFR